MKRAVLVVLSLLAGCAIHRTPDGDASTPGNDVDLRGPHVTLLICIFANCNIKPADPPPPK